MRRYFSLGNCGSIQEIVKLTCMGTVMSWRSSGSETCKLSNNHDACFLICSILLYIPAGRDPHERPAVPHDDLRVLAHQLPPEDGGNVGRRRRTHRRLLCLRRASLGGAAGRRRLPNRRNKVNDIRVIMSPEQFLSRCHISVIYLTYIDKILEEPEISQPSECKWL